MIGSTFIYETKIEKFSGFEIDALDDFTHISLNVLFTLDFELICKASGVRWASGNPVLFSEEDGLALFKVNEAGLAFVLNSSQQFDQNQEKDIIVLRSFVEKYGAKDIYELATF